MKEEFVEYQEHATSLGKIIHDKDQELNRKDKIINNLT